MPSTDQLDLRSVWFGALLLLGGVLLTSCAGSKTGPAPVTLAAEGKARWPVVIAANASPQAKTNALVLADYLGRISGAKFAVETGDGTRGIAFGTAADFPALKLAGSFDPRDIRRVDESLLRSHPDGLLIIGATEIAAQHGMWELLHRLGYRQYFPSPAWEIIPQAPTLALGVDEVSRPSYAGRIMGLSFGALSPEGNREQNDWLVKNRFSNIPGEPQLAFGHAYQELWREYPEEMKQHPEWVNHDPSQNVICWSQPGILDLMVKRSLNYLANNPDAFVVSAEPSDGCAWCDCEPCRAIGTPSDRALHVANAVAGAVEENYPRETKYVGLLAYAEHSEAPTKVRAHPRVWVSFTLGFYTGELMGLDLVRSWQAMGVKQFAVYEYLNVPQTSADMPGATTGMDPTRVAAGIRDYHRAGALQWHGECAPAFGPCGLGMYLAGRALWDVKQADDGDGLTEDFLTRSFGPAKEPMRKFYRHIDGRETPLLGQDYLGRMYRWLAEARQLAEDPAVRARIDELVLYTRYVELRYAANRGGNQREFAEPVLRLTYRIDRTHMVAVRALWYFWTLKDFPWRVKDLPPEVEFSNPEGNDPWKSSEPFTRPEIDAILAAGIASNAVVDIAPVAFSENLVPIARLGPFSGPRSHQFYAMAAGTRVFYVWAPEDKAAIRLTVRAGLLPQYRGLGPDKLTLYHPANSDQVVATATAPATGEPTAITFTPKSAGLYRLELADRGYSVIDVAPGTPFVEKWTRNVHPFNPTGAFWGFFYVPAGTKHVAGYAQDATGSLRDGSGKVVFSFAGGAFPGFFQVAVPPGQDGQVWKLDACGGNPFLMTVPPFIARAPEELLIPAELVGQSGGDVSRPRPATTPSGS